MHSIPALCTVQPHEDGSRLDHYLVRLLPEQSRSSLAKLVRAGHVQVNSSMVKPGSTLHSGDSIQIAIPSIAVAAGPAPQLVEFDILFEDRHLIVVSKPPGLVVHPAAGHADGTLVNGLLHHCGELLLLEGDRPGIVHRLDKDTSGVMLAAKSQEMQRLLSAAFQERKIRKTYHALLLRTPAAATGRIDVPIGRHPVSRQKMAVRPRDGRQAATNWRVLERFANGLCFAEIGIETGRTHQIRVHMAHAGAPVAGDLLYGGKVDSRLGVIADRQLLHASVIAFVHPATGEKCQFSAPPWPDMALALKTLREQHGLAQP